MSAWFERSMAKSRTGVPSPSGMPRANRIPVRALQFAVGVRLEDQLDVDTVEGELSAGAEEILGFVDGFPARNPA